MEKNKKNKIKVLTPMLKYVKKEVIQVNYYDLEYVINRVYNQGNFSIVEDLEMSNDSSKLVDVCKEELDDYDIEQIDKFIAGKDSGYMLQSLMTDMCNKDIIPAGNYLINISW